MANNTVLIIDYEPRSIRASSVPLERAGFAVHVAHDGIAGLSAFEKLKPAIVLIEAMLPKKHGFEVCQEIKKSAHGKGIPVIITTGVYRGRRYRSQALHIYGCDEYLEKPFTEEQLLEACRRFLGDTIDVPTEETEPASASASGSVPSGELQGQETAEEPEAAARAQQATGTDGRPAQPPRLTSVGDTLAEQEISARLEAILPGQHPTHSQEKASTAAAEESPSVDPPEKPRPFEPSADPSADLERSTEPVRAQAPEHHEPRELFSPREAEPSTTDPPSESSRKHRQDRRKKNRGGARRKRRQERVQAEQSADPVVEATATEEPAAPQEIMSAEQMFAELAAEMEAELPASTFDRSSLKKDLSETAAHGSDASDYHTPECVEALAEPYEATVADNDPETAAEQIEVSGVGEDADPVEAASTAIESATETGPSFVFNAPFEDDNRKRKSNRGLWLVAAAVLIVAMGSTLLLVMRDRGTLADPASARRIEPVDSSQSFEESTASAVPSYASPARSLESGAETLEVEADENAEPPIRPSEPTPSKNEPTDVGIENPAGSVSEWHADDDLAPEVEAVPEQAPSSAVAKTEVAEPEPEPDSDAVRDMAPTDPEPVVLAPATVASPEVVEPADVEELDDPAGSTTQLDTSDDTEGSEEFEAEGAEGVEAPPVEPPPPTTVRGDLVNLHDADRAPNTLTSTPPDYPMVSRRMKQQGTVVLNVLVDEDGTVAAVEIIRGVSKDLDEAAVRAVTSWTYEPAEKDGVAVKVWKPEKIAFKL